MFNKFQLGLVTNICHRIYLANMGHAIQIETMIVKLKPLSNKITKQKSCEVLVIVLINVFFVVVESLKL